MQPVDEAAPFLSALEALGVPYMATGGFAAMLYGEARFYVVGRLGVRSGTRW